MHRATITVLCLAALTGCTGSTKVAAPAAAATPQIAVVTSTNVYADLVRRIGGDRVAVTSFVDDPSQDPHSYQANARNQLAVHDAQLVIENGGGYDDFMDTMLNAAPMTNRQVLKVVDGEVLNEHVWYDVKAIDTLTDKLAATLTTLDPTAATTFHANATALHGDLQGLEQRETAIKAKDNGATVAITEPVPLYLLEACGLTNATPSAFSEAVEEGTDVPIKVLQDTVDLFNNHRVRALIYNEQTSGPQTTQVRDAAQRNNIPVVGVTETLPPGLSYVAWMTKNLDAIEAALA